MSKRLVDGLRRMPTASPIMASSPLSVHDVPSEMLSDSSISVRFWIEQLRGMLLAAIRAVSLSLIISKEPRRARPRAWQPREGSARSLESMTPLGTVGGDMSDMTVFAEPIGSRIGGSSTMSDGSPIAFAGAVVTGAVVRRGNEGCCGCTGAGLEILGRGGGFRHGCALHCGCGIGCCSSRGCGTGRCCDCFLTKIGGCRGADVVFGSRRTTSGSSASVESSEYEDLHSCLVSPSRSTGGPTEAAKGSISGVVDTGRFGSALGFGGAPALVLTIETAACFNFEM